MMQAIHLASNNTKPAIRALYGGTFDPPHYGHLHPLLETATALSLDNIELLPAHVPVFKDKASSITHRLAMTELLAKEDARLSVNTLELARNKPSYTVDTLAKLHAERSQIGNQTLIFIIGSDSLSNFHKWHNWQKVFDYCHVVVMCRGLENAEDEAQKSLSKTNLNALLNEVPACLALNLYNFHTSSLLFDDIVQSKMDDQSRTVLSSKLAQAEAAVQNSMKVSSMGSAFKEQLSASASGKLWLVNNQQIAVSSTFVRMQIKRGKSIRKWVPNAVADYIEQHQLYI